VLGLRGSEVGDSLEAGSPWPEAEAEGEGLKLKIDDKEVLPR
jgi:hypothetical protein